MITKTPYKLTRGMRALETSEPLAQVRTRDTQENIDRCLTCPISPDKCGGYCKGVPKAGGTRGRPMMAPVERVAQMVRDGWTDTAICRELGISQHTLQKKKTQCREQGLLSPCRRGGKT